MIFWFVMLGAAALLAGCLVLLWGEIRQERDWFIRWAMGVVFVLLAVLGVEYLCQVWVLAQEYGG